MSKKIFCKLQMDTTRNVVRALFPGDEIQGARTHVKMFLIPKGSSYQGSTADIPDFLVSDSMAKRFLELDPPTFMVIPEYNQIVNEIQRSYVLGHFFSALAAACVVIERTLNLARIKLHAHNSKIKQLWNKDSINEWNLNIDALQEWGYLDDALAVELKAIYREIRCSYLHSGDRYDFSTDSLRCIRAAYDLIQRFLGFPEDLFDIDQGRLGCKNTKDARFIEFYEPELQEADEGDD